MNNLIVKLLVLYWDSPLFVRKVISFIGKIVYKNSSNPRCKEYKNQISEICKQKGIACDKAICDDIIKSFLLFGASPTEYFLFNFRERSLKERDKFITDAYRTQLQKIVIGLDLFKTDLINKFNFYKQNMLFFDRECILLYKDTLYEEFRRFVQKHKSVFVKLNAGSFGYNAHPITFTTDAELERHYNDLHLNDGIEWIAEELVMQSPLMSIWNDSSVNTIRIPSFLIENGNHRIFRPFIRTGRKGAVVDNAGAGGIFAVIDEVTGIIITDGADEEFKTYRCHPDSKIQYKGWQIPKWDELIELSSKAHKNMLHHKYIAYDFALTDRGWVMIEGNWGQYVCQQTATQQGAKENFKQLLLSK